ncbi:hypothetical protein D6789_02610 [Candidatus Woesearchaeota archaeon]|nr:MAG: hypothetical protein D6789_02610 [Candidatus Woesearchaeota archaeon]
MYWAAFAFGSAFTHATLYALTKYYLKHVPRYFFLGVSYLFGAIALLAANLIVGLPVIQPGFISVVAVTTSLNIVAAMLYTRALEQSDISLAFPMLAFTPAFLLLTSPLLRGEWPSPLGVLGVLILVLGAYLLGLGETRDPLSPFRNFSKNRGMQQMLLVAFLFSITSNFDKEATLHSSPPFTALVMFSSWAIVFLLFHVLRGERKVPKKLALQTGLVGLVPAASAVLQNAAMLTAIVPYVMAIKRTSLLFNLLYARFLFDEQQLRQRGIAALIMLVGAGMILAA